MQEFVEKLKVILGTDSVKEEFSFLDQECVNTLGVYRKVPAIIFPTSTEEVLKVVALANDYSVALYPISRGKNIGYGEKLPVSDGQVIVDLACMNRIRDFDNISGQVVLEPGVTQAQLYSYLQKNSAKFWMDVTGAGLDASIVGNTLEGGFGHTPMGDHRATMSDVEIVLGNGTVLQTGTFPGLGPDLAGLFVQSCFGVVTAMKVQLMPIPERFESFLIKTPKDSGLESLVETLRELRQKNILTSLVHVANATRSLISTRKCPPEYADNLITCEDACQIMNSSLFKVGYWSAIGGIYGTKREVSSHKLKLKKAFSDIGKIVFFDDAKISSLSQITRAPFLKKFLAVRNIHAGLLSYGQLHGLMKGVPSDEAVNNIMWRVEKREEMGLIWYAPTVPATGSDVRKAVSLAEEQYEKFEFEFPVTITFVRPDQVVMVLSISFNKNNPQEAERAHGLYHALNKAGAREGIKPYRTGILGMKELNYQDQGKADVLRQLKNTFDPNNIISPGRYISI